MCNEKAQAQQATYDGLSYIPEPPPSAAYDLIAPAARLYEEEEELAALAKEDIGENDGFLSTCMQGGAYVLSKVCHAQCHVPCLLRAEHAC